MIDFTNIAYLKTGNPIQVQAYNTLTQNSIIEVLSEFDPILAGTIPININIENSDLDIICYWRDKTNFIEKLKLFFKNEKDFGIREIEINGNKSVIANFKTDHFEIEVFGQNIPSKNQNGYKHMIIEHEILQSKDENFRLEIIKLKQNGYKTEPAFAYLLGLNGDPYIELLKYKL
ncbi:DUF4269 domain-containing protein [Flavobacterium chilense]|uniref:Diadenosine tetraphosphate hydrolase n=1 Tax=Flavobacterium chilense TaxID=946677 RepID=A0A1M7MX53_9FLAO|nr:DUF4269 domain-containing protein [Flavobacterium chilense]SHM95221.1 protein of unknown function [Flavobacterium chilense]